jgi:hypothetical protein
MFIKHTLKQPRQHLRRCHVLIHKPLSTRLQQSIQHACDLLGLLPNAAHDMHRHNSIDSPLRHSQRFQILRTTRN